LQFQTERNSDLMSRHPVSIFQKGPPAPQHIGSRHLLYSRGGRSCPFSVLPDSRPFLEQFAKTPMAKIHHQRLIARHRFFLGTIGVFLTGCASVHTIFEASSYRYTNCPRSVQRAIHVGSADKQEIEKVGGEFIGTFYVDGNSEVEEEALLAKV